ncbi:MAG: GTP-binding protein, partial [Clostridia bacterium]|nr:GTP-binding protein [Clostridia bacterium]
TGPDGTRYNIIDTAGIRRKRAIEDESLERYSVIRSIAAIKRCDVALMLIDAQEGVTEQDARIAGMVHEEGKAAVVIVNKWDALDKETGTFEKYKKQVLEDLKFMDYAPVLFISALTGQRAQNVLPEVNKVYEQASRRIGTGALNDVLGDAQMALQPPVIQGRKLKIYYATQPATCPPTFALFINSEVLMHFSYQRYLENCIRKAFGFEGTPIRFSLREKKKEDAKP